MVQSRAAAQAGEGARRRRAGGRPERARAARRTRADPRSGPARARARARVPELAGARRGGRGRRRDVRSCGDRRAAPHAAEAAARGAARSSSATPGRGSSSAATGPATRTSPGGPLGWAPLVYACHSCFDTTAASRASCSRAAPTRTPFFVNEYGEMSALYGAAGVRHDPELTPRSSRPGRARTTASRCTTQPRPRARTACGSCSSTAPRRRAPTRSLHALDDDRLEHVRLLLEHGADPNESLVAHAVRRGRGPETIELLAAHGADLDRPGRRDLARRRAAAHAVPARRPAREGRLAELLARLGASTDVDARRRRRRGARARRAAGDAAAGAARPGRAGGARDRWPLHGRPRARRSSLVGPEFRGVVGGSPAGTLLHHAAWIGARRARRGAARTAAPTRPRARARTTTRRSRGRRSARRRHGPGPRLRRRGGAARRGRGRARAALPRRRRRPARRVASEHEHRVAERVEAVSLRDGQPVQPARLRRPPRTPSRARAASSGAGGSSSGARRRGGTSKPGVTNSVVRPASWPPRATVSSTRTVVVPTARHALGRLDPRPRLRPHRVALAVQLVLLERLGR